MDVEVDVGLDACFGCLQVPFKGGSFKGAGGIRQL